MISAFLGFVLQVCQDFNSLITGSRFWYFCSSSSVNFSVFGRRIFSISNFERGMLSRGSWRLKILFFVCFELVSGVLINVHYQLIFLFLLKGKVCLVLFCLNCFCCVLFLIHDEYGIGLNVEFPRRSTS